MIKSMGHSMTPKQMASFVLSHYIEKAQRSMARPPHVLTSSGDFDDEVEAMTDRELGLVAEAMERLIAGIADYAITEERVSLYSEPGLLHTKQEGTGGA